MNENKTTCQNSWNATKAIYKAKFKALNTYITKEKKKF